MEEPYQYFVLGMGILFLIVISYLLFWPLPGNASASQAAKPVARKSQEPEE